jgi:cytidine deaminase
MPIISKQPFEARLQALPADAAGRVRDMMLDPRFHGVINAVDAAALAALLGIAPQQLALALVPFAQLYAVTPISSFPVGAVGVGRSGALYYGANLEVAGQALSSAVHAEQAATANAWLHGELGLSALAVSAAPCGYCRQFLHELVDAATLEIMLSSGFAQRLTYFLPHAFGPHDLGVQGGLMQPESHGLYAQEPLDQTASAALAAANASYSPYTSTFAGVALRTSGGGIYSGRHAENAAYNPSMSPLQAALSQLVLHDQPFGSIVEAVLVEAQGPASQLGVTQAVLGCVTPTQLMRYTAVTG